MRTVLICCHQTCPKQGATEVLAAFQAQAPKHITICQSSCFGECGNGPMVRIMPDDVWYAHVQVEDVSEIINQHLRQNKPVKHKLYRKFHQAEHGAMTASLLFAAFFLFMGTLVWFLSGYTNSF